MTDIKPALTWEYPIHQEDKMLWACKESGLTRHALAALALHGQTFGFSREDVRVVLSASQALALAFLDRHDDVGRSEKLLNLAERLEALLPPEE